MGDFALELVDEEVKVDVFEVAVTRPLVCSVAKHVQEKDSFFGKDAAGVHVASVLRGVLLSADVRDDGGLGLAMAW